MSLPDHEPDHSATYLQLPLPLAVGSPVGAPRVTHVRLLTLALPSPSPSPAVSTATANVAASPAHDVAAAPLLPQRRPQRVLGADVRPLPAAVHAGGQVDAVRRDAQAGQPRQAQGGGAAQQGLAAPLDGVQGLGEGAVGKGD